MSGYSELQNGLLYKNLYYNNVVLYLSLLPTSCRPKSILQIDFDVWYSTQGRLDLIMVSKFQRLSLSLLYLYVQTYNICSIFEDWFSCNILWSPTTVSQHHLHTYKIRNISCSVSSV